MIELLPLALVVLYFVPFMVAAARDHDSYIAILVANLLTGWTVIGWLLCLAWAVFSPPSRVAAPPPAHLRRIL